MNVNPAVSYSIFNNYEYSNKSKAVSVLDVLSTPVRRLLGGRNVSMMSFKASEEWSRSQKKGFAIVSIIILAAGCSLIPVVPALGIILVSVIAISLFAFAVKALTLPWLWQKSSVQAEYDATDQKTTDFNTQFDSGHIDEALSILKNHPKLGSIPSVQTRLVKQIQQMIFEQKDKDSIAALIKTLPRKKGIDLVNFYISNTLVKSVYWLDPYLLNSFIATSLRLEGLAPSKKVELYKKILPRFALNSADFPIVKYYKMDIANGLIEGILLFLDSNQKISTENDLRLLIVDLSDPSLKNDYYYFFNGEASKNAHTVSRLRDQDRLQDKILSDLDQKSGKKEEALNLYEEVLFRGFMSLKLQTLKKTCVQRLKNSSTDAEDDLRKQFADIVNRKSSLLMDAVEQHIANSLWQLYKRLEYRT